MITAMTEFTTTAAQMLPHATSSRVEASTTSATDRIVCDETEVHNGRHDETVLQETINRSTVDPRGPKVQLPAFTGKGNETWKVYHARFSDYAKRKKWTDDEKLDILIPRLQDDAASFVYDQLTEEERTNYSLLCKELNNRFVSVDKIGRAHV